MAALAVVLSGVLVGCASTPEPVRVPDVIGKPLKVAERDLQSVHLNYKLTYTLTGPISTKSSPQPPNVIVGQSPDTGTLLTGKTVNLTVRG